MTQAVRVMYFSIIAPDCFWTIFIKSIHFLTVENVILASNQTHKLNCSQSKCYSLLWWLYGTALRRSDYYYYHYYYYFYHQKGIFHVPNISTEAIHWSVLPAKRVLQVTIQHTFLSHSYKTDQETSARHFLHIWHHLEGGFAGNSGSRLFLTTASTPCSPMCCSRNESYFI